MSLTAREFWAVIHGMILGAVFHTRWKNAQVNFACIFMAALILIALGLLGTFPVFFELFGG